MQELDFVVITSSRIELPFKESSRTIMVISSSEIKQSSTTNIVDLPLKIIEHIEIIKGSAARVFGQNALTGAVNIFTKRNTDLVNAIAFQVGSYNRHIRCLIHRN